MGEPSATEVLTKSSLPGVELVRRGKVRELYDLGDSYLIVASDRISAFDVVLTQGIPQKGRVLTQLSLFWFDLLGAENHLISADIDDLPESCRPYADQLRGRFMIVKKLEILPVECIVRGYLAGSGFKEYQADRTVSSIPLPDGLQNSSRLPEVLFTPSTKAVEGHDENISYEECEKTVGVERAAQLRDMSLAIYSKAAEYALTKGIIIADTKFEFGVLPDSGEIVLADEVLTPDSSRFWPQDLYEPGKSQPSFDKQYVRDWLETQDWDKTPPPPDLPDEVTRETSSKYIEIFQRLTGKSWSV